MNFSTDDLKKLSFPATVLILPLYVFTSRGGARGATPKKLKWVYLRLDFIK